MTVSRSGRCPFTGGWLGVKNDMAMREAKYFGEDQTNFILREGLVGGIV
jgi:hypothetical protein